MRQAKRLVYLVVYLVFSKPDSASPHVARTRVVSECAAFLHGRSLTVVLTTPQGRQSLGLGAERKHPQELGQLGRSLEPLCAVLCGPRTRPGTTVLGLCFPQACHQGPYNTSALYVVEPMWRDFIFLRIAADHVQFF